MNDISVGNGVRPSDGDEVVRVGGRDGKWRVGDKGTQKREYFRVIAVAVRVARLYLEFVRQSKRQVRCQVGGLSQSRGQDCKGFSLNGNIDSIVVNYSSACEHRW